MRTFVILGVIGAIIGFLFWYGTFAFVNLEANPTLWNEAVRAPFAIFLLPIVMIFSILPIVIYSFYKTHKPE